MARRWLRRWCKPRVRNYEVFGTEVLGAVATSLRIDAALRHNSDQHARSLYQLPGDLLFMIIQYLTPAEAITLMLTCTRFWHSRTGNGVFARLWQQMTSPVDEELSRMATRFYVMRMLEYDGLLQKGSPSKYCCWGCMKVHKRQAFSPEEFGKVVDLKSKQDSYPEEAARRSCAPSKRNIWVGVCREMSFVELRHAIANPHTQQLVKDWIKFPDNSSFAFQDCSLFAANVRRFEYMIDLAWTRDVRTYTGFKRHARAVDIPLCPHLRLGDPDVYRAYLQQGKPYTCKRCTTTFRIGGIHVLKVQIFRYVGSLLSPTDPAWMAQSYRKRRQWLEADCRAFCEWYGSMYGGNGQVATGGQFRRSKSKELDMPFMGVASCKPGWPPGSRPHQIECSKS